MGPVGVGKTFLATALGHAAVRRKYSVIFERADRLFKRLRAARLDQTYDEQMRRLQRAGLLILDDLAPAPPRDDRDQRLLRTRRRAPPHDLDDHDLQPRPRRNRSHDDRPAAGPIRDRPAPVRGLRTHHRRPGLPPTPEARRRSRSRPELTASATATTLNTTARDHPGGPQPLARRWSLLAGRRQKYFELIRSGVRGAEAARQVGVSLSCGSVWFVDAGRVQCVEKPISSSESGRPDRDRRRDRPRRRGSTRCV